MANNELQESVLVLSRQAVDKLCPRTFSRDGQGVAAAALANCRFLERTVAEHDFRWKQVIPYVVIRHEDRYLLMRRSDRQTESRLHDKYSLGVGGHINKDDLSAAKDNVILAGMRRELAEEIRVEAEESCQLIGAINDDTTEVARVHLGLVFLLRTSSARFTIVEEDKHTAAWRSVSELAQYYEQMETWAQIAHDYVVLSGAGERVRKWEQHR
ncbi:MAG: NUDIX domain-containing protein [Verrucomicrobiota bacterium]